jgi:hypothetical protein
MGRSEAYKKRRAKHRVIRRHLERAEYRTNASFVSAVITHNGRVVKTFPYFSGASRYEEPNTDLRLIRSGGRHSEHASRDGEVFMIDRIDAFLSTYIPAIADYQDDQKRWRTRTGFKDQGDPFHEISIQFVGPRGTCGDCQAALRTYRYNLAQRYPRSKAGIKIWYKIGARYPTSTQWDRRDNDQRLRNTRGLSYYYGSNNAALKEGIGKIRRRWVPQHWKIKLF